MKRWLAIVLLLSACLSASAQLSREDMWRLAARQVGVAAALPVTWDTNCVVNLEFHNETDSNAGTYTNSPPSGWSVLFEQSNEAQRGAWTNLAGVPCVSLSGNGFGFQCATNSLLNLGIGSWTIGAWLRRTNYSPWSEFYFPLYDSFSSGAGQLAIMLYSNTVNFYTWNESRGYGFNTTWEHNLGVNAWKHLAITCSTNGLDAILYIDGQAQYTSTIAAAMSVNNAGIKYVGKTWNGAAKQPLLGYITKFRLYTNTLSAGSITALYEEGP